MPSLAQRTEPTLSRVQGRSAGIAVGVWEDEEELTWAAGELPAGADSVFEIGSITKLFTSTLLVDMARDGLVALDDPVQELLPAGMTVRVRGRPITLQDLACHGSGLPRLPKGVLPILLSSERADPYARLDAERLSRALARTAQRREPGARWAYSNLGAGLLGFALAQRAGCSYDELVRRRISIPLGLRDTGTEIDGGRLAAGHSRLGRPRPHWHFDALAGAGALRSTVSDLLTFLRLHAGEPPGSLADAVAEMRRARLHRGPMGFGLGWVIMPGAKRLPFELLIHDGGTAGFRSFAALAPERRIAVVVLANRVRGVQRIAMRLLEELAETGRPPGGR